MIKKWFDNIDSVFQGNGTTVCPYCGSENTDYRVIEVSNGYGDIWCKDCKKAIHLSRIKVSSDEEHNNNIKLPQDLIF